MSLRSNVEESFEQYQDTIRMFEAVLEQHPEFMCALAEGEQEVIWNYYFSGRELEDGALEHHWERLIEEDPNLPAQAHAGLASFQSLTKTAVSLSGA